MKLKLLVGIDESDSKIDKAIMSLQQKISRKNKTNS